MGTRRWICAIALAISCDGGEVIDAGDEPTDAGRADAGSDAGVELCTADPDCDDAVFCDGAERCDRASPDADARGCVSSAAPCEAPLLCVESTASCESECPDEDGDGHDEASCGGDDCDDTRAEISPDATEVCDGDDNDCDGMTDEELRARFYADADADGFGVGGDFVDACTIPAGRSAVSGDCDDTDPAVHPAAVETCNGVDDNCDTRTDEGVTTRYWPDADGDGYGVIGNDLSVLACAPPPDTAARSGDCDDTDSARSPATMEACNGIDDDCDGLLDAPGEDADGDGALSKACGGFDCDDMDPGSPVGMAEVCNDVDDDCDGSVDETLRIIGYLDADMDGVGVTSTMMTACVLPPGYVAIGGDCDDAQRTIYPGAVEECNGRDDDCDAFLDEGADVETYADADADGYGVGTALRECTPSPGRAIRSGDCDDARATVYPGAPDLCDRLDNDCVAGGASDDMDADGYLVTGATCAGGMYAGQPRTDCDDTNAARNPGAAEVCNGIDDDCDVTIDGAAANARCAALGGFHGVGTCAPTGCQLTCETNWLDCSSSFVGCETNRLGSSMSCGSCGNTCPAGQACNSGACFTRYQSQRSLDLAYVRSVAVDAANNVYATGNYYGTVDFGGTSRTAATQDTWIASYTPAMALRWVVTFGTSSSFDAGKGIAVDDAGNVYVTGWNGGTSAGGATLAVGGFLASYTTAGAFRWSRNMGNDGRAIAYDPTAGVVVVGQYAAPGFDFGGGNVPGGTSSYGNIYAASYTTAGAWRFARGWSTGGTMLNTAMTAAVAPGGEIYFTATSSNSVNYGGGVVTSGPTLVALTSGGVFRWQKRGMYAVGVDPVGNVYAAGSDPEVMSTGFPPSGAIVSYTSAGVLRWGAPYVGAVVNAIDADSAQVYVGGSYSSSSTWIGAGLMRERNGPFIGAFATSNGAHRWSYAAQIGDGSGSVSDVDIRSGPLLIGTSWGGGFNGPLFGGPRIGTGGLVWWTP
jgi:hypothetical protein